MVEIAASLLTLTIMELVLGIDNIVFLALLTGQLPADQQRSAQRLGLFLALFLRIALLFAISWLTQLTTPLFYLAGHAFSLKGLILICGGVFLFFKATQEIYKKTEPQAESSPGLTQSKNSYAMVIVQVLLLDMVFSIDSVLTAVGMARERWIMITGTAIAMLIMMFFAGSVSRFIHRHPSMKILALSFLLLIGTVLILDGMGQSISKGYIYAAMAFSFGVEILNLALKTRQQKTTR